MKKDTTENTIKWLEDYKYCIESMSEPIQQDDKWVYTIQMKDAIKCPHCGGIACRTDWDFKGVEVYNCKECSTITVPKYKESYRLEMIDFTNLKQSDDGK